MVPESTTVRGEVGRQEDRIHDDFNRMMSRLSQVEEGIGKSRKGLE